MRIRGKDYKVTTTGYFVVGLLAIGILFLVMNLMRPTPGSCSQFAAAGKVNIKKGDSAYNPALDNDHDGISCELK